MQPKRTDIDFSKHEVLVTKENGLLVHYIKKPNTVVDSVKFINTNYILAVTGDYGNWIFCREFHPSADNYVSDSYWIEKLKISSTQVPGKYDSTKTEEEIRKLLAEDDIDEDKLTNEEKEYLNDLLLCVDDEFEYTYSAYRNNVGKFSDYERVPYTKTLDYGLLAVFDAFDEICRRMKEEST